MRKPPRNIVTELPPSPDQELRSREIKYGVMMGIRVICVILVAVLGTTIPGWWWAIPALGGVFIPYFAVVVANATGPGQRRTVERPGAISLFVHREDNEG